MKNENNKLMKEIGHKIKFMRNIRNISSADFAQMIGVSRQQLQSYESGVSDIKIDRLYEIAQNLGINITFFFEDNSDTTDYDIDLSIFPKLSQIKDPKIKESIYGLLNELSNN